MSPFANQPELWLTCHLQRLQQADNVVKIQAVARGFLARIRKERKQKKLSKMAQSLLTPTSYNTLADALIAFGLPEMARCLPTAKQAFAAPVLDEQRRDILWHAKVLLRYDNKIDYVAELQWADYRERAAALREKPVEPPAPSKSLFSFFKLPWE